jgi:tRNA-dihydrouridine synthase 2
MVRIGTLPMRLLALRYGADFVFTPEVIAKKLAASTSKRIENKIWDMEGYAIDSLTGEPSLLLFTEHDKDEPEKKYAKYDELLRLGN